MDKKCDGIITIVGSDSKVGTTMVSQTLGKILGRHGKKVLIVLQGNTRGLEYCDLNGEEFSDDIGKTLGAIKEGGEDLWQQVGPQVIQKGKASYLAISKELRELDELSPAQIKDFLLKARDYYEYVIYDGGFHFDSGATIGAMELACRVCIVTTQQQKSLDRLDYMVKAVIKPLGIVPDLIINKYVGASYGTPAEISEGGKWQRVHTLPYISYGWDCECGHSTLLRFPKYSERMKAYEETI